MACGDPGGPAASTPRWRFCAAFCRCDNTIFVMPISDRILATSSSLARCFSNVSPRDALALPREAAKPPSWGLRKPAATLNQFGFSYRALSAVSFSFKSVRYS